MTIDVHRLRVLVALAQEGTVTAAAESLHYGQSTVTHHLHQLQAETGTVLFQRVGRGLRLTPDGERLARYGSEILGLLRRAEADLDSATALRDGRVRLAAFPSALATVVPTALARLRERAPGLRVDLVEAEPPQAMELLTRGEVDLALAFTYPDQAVPARFTTFHLFDDPLFLVSPSSAPLSDVHHAVNRPWITGCEQCRGELLSVCARHAITPDIALATDDYVAVQSLVASGFGITVLPQLALAAYRHPGVAAAELDGHLREVMVISLGAPPMPAAHGLVIELLQTQAGRARRRRDR